MQNILPRFWSIFFSARGVAAALMVGGIILLTGVLLLGERRLINRLVDDKVAELELAHTRWHQGLQSTVTEGEANIQRYATLVSAIDAEAAQPSVRADWIARFDREIGRDPDGAWRSRRPLFDANSQAGVWIPPTGLVDDQMKYFYARCAEVTSYFGCGAQGSTFGNTWLLTAAQGEVEFDPSMPNFIYEAGTDFPYADTPWMALAEPAANPQGHPQWTPATFDPLAGTWMASVVAPFKLQGAWGGSVGHDLVLDVFLGQQQQALPVKEQELLVFDSDGLLIVSTIHAQEIRNAAGKLTIKGLRDVRSLAALTAATETPENAAAARFSTADDVVFTAHLAGPNWTTIALVPRPLLTATISEQFNYLRFALLLTIAVVGLLAVLLFAADVKRRTLAQRDSTIAAEAAVTARQVAEDANRLKDRFLTSMSHELRTPMTGIIGMSELLADSTLTSDQREQVEALCNSSHTLVSIITDVLDLAEIEADRFSLARSPLDLEVLVQETITRCRTAAGEKSIGLTHTIASGVRTSRMGDGQRLKQILYNLTANAVQFTNQGWVDISISEHRDGIEIIVSDSGVGIAADQLPRLFDQLAPAKDAQGRSPSGLGLGLAITRRLVLLMGGTIHVTSVVGKGTVVTLYLPLQALEGLG